MYKIQVYLIHCLEHIDSLRIIPITERCLWSKEKNSPYLTRYTLLICMCVHVYVFVEILKYEFLTVNTEIILGLIMRHLSWLERKMSKFSYSFMNVIILLLKTLRLPNYYYFLYHSPLLWAKITFKN